MTQNTTLQDQVGGNADSALYRLADPYLSLAVSH